MSETLVWAMLVVPLVLAALQGAGFGRAIVERLTPWAALPGLLAAGLCRTGTVDASWMLLESRLGVDVVGRVFLAVTAALWLAAGLYTRSYMARDAARGRFQVFFLLTMTGNLGVTVAQDGASFLMFFTLMSLAAYGLVVHDRRPASLRAGRVYMVMTIAGEMLLFAGLVLLAHETRSLDFEGLAAGLAASPRRDLIVALMLAGFGIKLGVMPLHVWLPLAHPAAPTPASAVLSGAIIKTGLLGLIRTLPLGAVALSTWGDACLLVGVATCLLGALIGITQRNPKAVLAYSSISQMGLVTVCLAAALAVPAAWPTVATALLVWVVHHAFAKAALFLGVGVAGAQMPSDAARRLVAAGLVFSALALAGLPLTMGFAAKAALKYSTAAVEVWTAGLTWILPLTSVTTTLLVSRFLWLVWPRRGAGHGSLTAGMIIPWLTLSTAVIAGFFVMRWHGVLNPTWISLAPQGLWTGIWPLLIAGGLVGAVIATRRRTDMATRINVPEGDLVVPVTTTAFWLRRHWHGATAIRLPRRFQILRQNWIERAEPALSRWLDHATRTIENDLAAGLLIALLAVILVAMSWW